MAMEQAMERRMDELEAAAERGEEALAIRAVSSAKAAKVPDAYPSLSCVGTLLFLLCFVAAMRLGWLAFTEGETEVLRWLLWGHLPFVALIARLVWQDRREHRRDKRTVEQKTREQAARPKLLRTPLRLCIRDSGEVLESGIAVPRHRFVGWDEIEGYAFYGEAEPWFALHLRRRKALPSGGIVRRIVTDDGFWMSLSLLTPSAITFTAFVVGQWRFGWRLDVQAVLLAACAHGIVLTSLAWEQVKRRRRTEDSHEKEDKRHLYLVFDSREVSAQEVLRRLGRYLPAESDLT
jgi:hypothetical protein